MLTRKALEHLPIPRAQDLWLWEGEGGREEGREGARGSEREREGARGSEREREGERGRETEKERDKRTERETEKNERITKQGERERTKGRERERAMTCSYYMRPLCACVRRGGGGGRFNVMGCRGFQGHHNPKP